MLIVDDEPDLAHAMELVLTRAGFSCQTTGSGHAARAVVLRDHIDVVVMDRGLPDMDGLDATALLRADGYAGPLVVVSGYGAADHVAASLAAGADVVLVKPFPLAELVAEVRAAVERLGEVAVG